MINIAKRVKNPTALLQLLDKPEGKDLVNAIQDVGLDLLLRLRKENDEKEIFRLQGKLEVVSAISDLKKEIQSLLEGKTNVVLEQKRAAAGTA